VGRHRRTTRWRRTAAAPLRPRLGAGLDRASPPDPLSRRRSLTLVVRRQAGRMSHNRTVYAVSILLAGGIAAALLLRARLGAVDPEFEGKRISAWFGQLFSMDRNGNNVPVSCVAEGAFTRMKSEAVPYLLARVKYSPLADRLVVWLKRNVVTSRWAKRLTLASDKQRKAISVLCQMGPSAMSAVPALLKTWEDENSTDVKQHVVFALGCILDRTPQRGVLLSEWAKFESETIAEAKRRLGGTAQHLAAASVAMATGPEPGGPANGSQPIRSETQRTSAPAGSRR
jgi:hypothetical protein